MNVMNVVLARLDTLSNRMASEHQRGLGPTLNRLREYAITISPVVTGSYRASHEVVERGLRISPTARNDGVPVRQYAGSVERKHQVYKRTAVYARSISDETLKDLVRELTA